MVQLVSYLLTQPPQTTVYARPCHATGFYNLHLVGIAQGLVANELAQVCLCDTLPWNELLVRLVEAKQDGVCTALDVRAVDNAADLTTGAHRTM